MSKSMLGTLVVGAALVVGCAENEESLLVLNVPAWADDGTCVVVPNMDGLSLTTGVLDLSFGTPYAMPASLFNNTAEQEEGSNNAGIITNELQLLDADVDLSMAQAPEIIDGLRDSNPSLVSFNVPMPTVSILPQQLQGVLVEVVPQPTAAALRDAVFAEFGMDARATLEAKVVFHASRSGNTIGKVGGVDSRDFSFPIQLCFGCLVTCSSCDDGQCPVGDFGIAGGVCGNAQDLDLYPAACDEPD